MALPTSGVLSMSQVNTELGKAADAVISLNDTAVRTLAGVPSGAIAISNLYGKSSIPVPTISKKSQTGYYDYYRVVVNVSPADAVTSAKWVSGGSYLSITKVSNTTYDLRNTRATYTGYNGTLRVTATNSAGSAYVDFAIPYLYNQGYIDSSGGCCFTGDSLVSMWDGSYKRIDEIQPGDLVKTPFGYSEVDWIRLPMLDDRPLLAMEGGKCKTSGEHNIWAKHPITGEEWWATRDIGRWAFERDYELGPGLNGYEPIDLIELGCSKATYATERGWQETEWYTVEGASPDTQLYHLYLKDHASYFVDGFLVIGELPRLESKIDWKQFSWNPEAPQTPVYMEYDYELPEVDRSPFKRIELKETEE